MYPMSISAQDHRKPTEKKRPLPRNVKTISQWFSDAGYHTCLMGNPKKDYNFREGDETFQSNDWSNSEKGQPFFCIYNFVEPHRWGWNKWDQLTKHIDPNTVELAPYYHDNEVMRESYGKYLDFIVELDRKVGLVLKRLEEENLLDETIIFYFGDNGRTMYRGKQWLYDEGLRVPMIARHPSLFKPSTVRTDLVSLIDVAPTSLSLAGIEVPGSMQGSVFAGKNASSRKYIFASRDLCDQAMDPMRCVRDNRYKYIRNERPQVGYEIANYTKLTHPEWGVAKKLYEQGRLNDAQSLMFASRKPKEELYDLEKDPFELKNLVHSPGHQDILESMRNALDIWISETRPICDG
jgi:arylsulfatase A-like enzyme